MLSEVMDTLLESLIAMPSVCGDIPAAHRILSFVEKQLRDIGLHVERYEQHKFPSLVATTRKTKTPKVLLAGHLDTVDAPDALFKLRLEDGKYYGRGVLDMKSAIANYIHVLEGIKHSLADYDIGVMLTTDEEYFGMHGTGMLVDKGYLPKVCILPDSGFGTNWQIESFAKGCWFAQITSLGISAHGSRPWEGDSASIKLVRALDAITRLFDDKQKPNTATLNVSMMRGGTSINQIPAAGMATLDIRYADMDDYRKLKRWISAICDQYGISLKTIRKASAPTHNNIDHPLIATFTKHVATQTSIQPQAFTAYGATDARFFDNYGIPCVLMSPPGGGHHSNDEWLSLEGYAHFRSILRNYLDEVARTTIKGSALPTSGIAIAQR